jgi:predicted DsbA family dithiol-disulfide isomerase
MPNYCTVCGVKLTAKNKISYRPSSCRDCELERKRLYSLKRKIQNELEEKLFQAYFTDGKNTADHSTLLQIGKELGIDEKEITDVLHQTTNTRFTS